MSDLLQRITASKVKAILYLCFSSNACFNYVAVALAGSTAPKTRQPSITSQSCRIYGVVLDGILFRKKAMYNLLPCFYNRRGPTLLFWHWELPLLEYELRYG